MSPQEMAELLGMDGQTARVILQQPNNPFGYCFKKEGNKQFTYIINASRVLEYAGKINIKQLLMEALQDEAMMDWFRTEDAKRKAV